VAGSKAIYTSADEPGLIYDVIAVTPQSLAQRRDDWKKFAAVWDRVVAFIQDPKTHDEAVKIMASRVGTDAKEYETFMKGTRLLTLGEGAKYFASQSKGFDSLTGSSQIANDFNVKNGVYKEAQSVASYIDGSIVAEIVAAKK
jgi:NitT/TauT family transport system substrate-binding protein